METALISPRSDDSDLSEVHLAERAMEFIPSLDEMPPPGRNWDDVPVGAGAPKKKPAWPVPHVVRCLDDGIGTVARPLTQELYLQPGDLRHIPLRLSKEKSVKKERKFCHCSCFATFVLVWLGILLVFATFYAGMYMESKYFHRFKRNRRVKWKELEVECPGGQFRLDSTTVTKFEAVKSVGGVSASSEVECRAMCEKDKHCLRAFFHPTGRNCYLWLQSHCDVKDIPSRNNEEDMYSRDCVSGNCTLFERVCTGCKKEIPLAQFWHINGCLRVRDYRNVRDQMCD